jgi:hypothetical protein
LGPVFDKLAQKRLLIVPDGALQYIPFQALLVPATPRSYASVAITKTKNTQDGKVPLIFDHEVVYELSASALAMVMSDAPRENPPPYSIAVFADPVFEADDSRVSRNQTQSVAAAPRKQMRAVFAMWD